jgi:uncharacterized protein YdiU (UPF0061 family)
MKSILYIIIIILIINMTSVMSKILKRRNTFDELNFVNTFAKSVTADPVSSNHARQVPSSMLSFVNPTPITSSQFDIVLYNNEFSENELNLSAENANSTNENLVKILSGGATVNSTKYYAHCYGGWQFGYYAGQLGDGRAIALGQIQNDNGQLYELELKGAGQTPYSRRGDGRAVLRSSIREFLCSESMYHMNVPTTRALSLVKSRDEIVPRDEFYNWNVQLEHAAIVLRVAPCFIRFGSFEIFYYRYKDAERAKKEHTYMEQLLNYVIRNHYLNNTEQEITEQVKLDFVRQAVQKTARMIADWQTVGFVHGVMNTDNMSILGLTIDYGPFGFVDYFDRDFVPNHSDSEGRYSYANQPDIGYWNCEKLVTALGPLFSDRKQLKDYALGAYWETYQTHYLNQMRKKLGLVKSDEGDLKLIEDLFDWMHTARADMTNFFRRLSHPENIDNLYQTMQYNTEENRQKFQQWMSRYKQRLDNDEDAENRVTRMNSANPKYILRNWIAHEAIQKAKKGDYAMVQEVYEVLKHPYDELSQEISDKYAVNAPNWASDLKCSCSS